MIFPCDNHVLRAEVSQRQTYEVLPSQSLPFDLEKLLAKLIHQELRFAATQEQLKQELTQQPRYSMSWFFREMTGPDQSKDAVDRVLLKKFLNRFSFIPNDNLILAIIRRIDLDSDAKLAFSEFSEAIRPIESNQRASRMKSAKARKFKKSAMQGESIGEIVGAEEAPIIGGTIPHDEENED